MTNIELAVLEFIKANPKLDIPEHHFNHPHLIV